MSLNIEDIGLDVHQEAISVTILNRAGKLVMESIIETKAYPGAAPDLRGELHVTLEEGS